MSARNQRLRRKEMLVMARNQRLGRKEMTARNQRLRENTMIFSDLRRKLLCLKEKYWAAAGEDSDEEEFINLALMATSEEQEASLCRLSCINLKSF